jgi:hypothetical protein
MYPEIADRKLCFGLFCHPFADPSHKLRASAQDHGDRKGVIPSLRSGQRLTLLFCHSLFFVILTLSEAKGKNLIPKLSF